MSLIKFVSASSCRVLVLAFSCGSFVPVLGVKEEVEDPVSPEY